MSTARLLALTPGALRRGTVSRFKGEKLFQHELKLQILDHTVDVLMTVARPEVSRNFLALTDITKLKTAEDALRRSELQYREVQMELAHANRVATMGQLTASIAHEVNQPIAAALTNAETADAGSPRSHQIWKGPSRRLTVLSTKARGPLTLFPGFVVSLKMGRRGWGIWRSTKRFWR